MAQTSLYREASWLRPRSIEGGFMAQALLNRLHGSGLPCINGASWCGHLPICAHRLLAGAKEEPVCVGTWQLAHLTRLQALTGIESDWAPCRLCTPLACKLALTGNAV
eukprot:scaffold21344_cov20-Tisochrysis_lutea.AAC.2